MIQVWKRLMVQGLDEDQISFDWTARSIGRSPSKKETLTASLVAKSSGIWAGEQGLRALELLSGELGTPIAVESFKKNGDRLAPRDSIAALRGRSEAIVGFERTLINLTAYASGIATQTEELVARVRARKMKSSPRITATRKTLPGYKEIAVESTLIGGAHPHRFNLSGGVLLKENHIAAFGGITAAVTAARQTAPHLLKIEVEVRNLEELREALSAGAEVIMLDNFDPDQIRAAIPLKTPGVVFEVSGGIHAGNLDSYLIEGLDVISVGSITHSVKSLDLSLLMEGLSS